jgi:hypothetical protein
VLLVAGLGMGMIFAPLATMAMRAAPPRLAGAASGVLNTGRQFGATLGAAVSGAILASALASAVRVRALAGARSLPPAVRPGFVSGFARAASGGLQVGRGQGAGAVAVPRSVPAAVAAQIHRLASDVFAHSYIAAMRPTLAVSVALLVAGAALCLLLPGLRAPAPARAVDTEAAPASAAVIE